MNFQAKTLEEAIIKAAIKLNISASSLKYEVIQNPKKGFLGFFQKDAIIKVEQKQNATKDSMENSVKITNQIIKNIENDILDLLSVGLYKIDLISVEDKKDYVYIKLDGEDAIVFLENNAKKYHAFHHLLYNFIYSKYGVSFELEVADYLKEQKKQLKFYTNHIIEMVEKNGKFTTKPLENMFIKEILGALRLNIPNKYIGVKNIKSNANKKQIIVCDFIKHTKEN